MRSRKEKAKMSPQVDKKIDLKVEPNPTIDLAKLVYAEPLRSNRWIIEVNDGLIPSYLFTGYKLYNNGEDIHLDTEIYETVNYLFSIENFFNITDVFISELDPIGAVVHKNNFTITKSNFSLERSYNNDNLSTVTLKFVIKVKK
jgi:hypothetical protein